MPALTSRAGIAIWRNLTADSLKGEHETGGPVQEAGFRRQGSGFRVQSSGFRVLGSEFMGRVVRR